MKINTHEQETTLIHFASRDLFKMIYAHMQHVVKMDDGYVSLAITIP